MRFHSLNLLFMLFALSCDERKTDSHVHQVRSQGPYHSDVEFYILGGPQSGAVSTPNSEAWKDGLSWLSLSTGDVNEQTKQTINNYEMKYQYKGSGKKNLSDLYLITMSPPDSDQVTMEVEFDGSQQEIWKDARYSAGIRPKGKK